MKLNKKGFTLVELLAVIAVLSIIIGIATMNVISAINKSKSEIQKEMIGNLKEAAKMYCNAEVFGPSVNKCSVTVQELINSGDFENNNEHCDRNKTIIVNKTNADDEVFVPDGTCK